MKILIKRILTRIFFALFRVRVRGLENLPREGAWLAAANHVSYFDGPMLAAVLPDEVAYAVDEGFMRRPWMRPFKWLLDLRAVGPEDPMALRRFGAFLKDGGRMLIFPEGRVSPAGVPMKIYGGAFLIAEKSGHPPVVPIHIAGAERGYFALRPGRKTLLPQITVTIGAAQNIAPPAHLSRRERKRLHIAAMERLLAENAAAAADIHTPLTMRFVRAAQRAGYKKTAFQDQMRALTWRRMLTACFALQPCMRARSGEENALGIMMPTSVGGVVALYAALFAGRAAAMLNFTAGGDNVLSACRTAQARRVITARRFVEMAKLAPLVEHLEKNGVEISYMEDLGAGLTLGQKLRAMASSYMPMRALRRLPGAEAAADKPAVILFTSGSEGKPKGVALSQKNIAVNLAQVHARLPFWQTDTLLHTLPIFHSFGMFAVFLCVDGGAKCFLHPSPLRYKQIPELAYLHDATVFVSANTFLARYGKYAHPADFHKMRLVVAGAEKLTDATRRLWREKFGVRILEGYGVTECSPVISFNTPGDNRDGSAGRMLPMMEHRLEKVEGVEEGGRLMVRGGNVMLGYMFEDHPGQIQPPADGWHDTGDVCALDDEMRLYIVDRARRFAKVSGEMVPLGRLEAALNDADPGEWHCVSAVADEARGEAVVALGTRDTTREEIAELLRARNLPELWMPRRYIKVDEPIVLATGKTDYQHAKQIAAAAPPAKKQSEAKK